MKRPLLPLRPEIASSSTASPSAPRPASSFLRRAVGVVFALAVGVAPSPAAPITLEEAIRLALARNPTIKVESYSPTIARANLLTAYGFFDPSLNFRRSYSHDENPSAADVVGGRPSITRSVLDVYELSLDGILPWGMSYSLGGEARNARGTNTGFRDDFETFAGVSITQPLLRDFGFSSNLASIRIAKADRAISDWDYRQIVIEVLTRVIFVYNDLQLAKDNYRITAHSRELAAQLLRDNEKRFRVGARSEADVIEVRARAARREEAILFAERTVRDTENIFRQLIGEDVFVTGEIEITMLQPAPTIAVSPALDMKVALEQRPDYQAARMIVQRNRYNSSRARNQLLPRLDFVGSYGYAGADQNFRTSRRQVRDEDNTSWSAGVQVSVPLTFAEGRGRVRAARLQYQQAEENLNRLEREIAVEVANAAGQIETTQQRVVATRNALALGHQNLEAEEKKLTAGTGNTFTVLEAQESLSDLEGRVARAQTDHRKAIAHYDRVLGRTLERLNVTLGE